jgi:MFS family permease
MSTLQKLDKPESAAAAYVLIISGVVAALQIGKLPPALPELSTSLGLSLMQAGFLLSLVQLAGMSLALVVGLSADGIGLRRSMLMGLIVLGLASAMGALAQSAAALMFWRAIEGLGFLWVTLPAPGLIRKRVSEQQVRKLLGYWGAYMPAGTALTLLVGPLWLPVWGWQTWWCMFAVLSWVMALVLWRVVPADSVLALQHPAHSSSSALQIPWPQRLRETLSASGPWLVALSFAMYSGQWLAVVGFLPSIYTQAGLTGLALGGAHCPGCCCQHGGQHVFWALVAKGPASQCLAEHGIWSHGFGIFLGIF